MRQSPPPNWVLRTAIGPAILAAPAVGNIPRQYGGDSGRAQHLAGVMSSTQ